MNNSRYPFQKSWRWFFIKAFDFLSRPFAHKNRQKLFPESVKNILVIRIDHIGDVVCSIPVFEALKENYPQAKITALVSKEGAEILKGNPFIDQVVVFQANWFSRGGIFNPSMFFQICFRFKKENFDLGYDLRGDLRNILLMVFANVHFRIGYGIAGGGALLHREVDYDLNLHQAELNLKLISDKKKRLEGIIPKIYLEASEQKAAQAVLKESGVQPGEFLIALHPEAGSPAKEWKSENFIQLINEFAKIPKTRVLILGLSRAKTIGARVSSPKVLNFGGRISLRQMIAVLNFCHLFVGHDSGPSHLAQALNVPSVILASGTNEYHKWGIWHKSSRILSHSVPCAPCHLSVCIVEGHPCMSQIKVHEVLNAVNELTKVSA